MTFVKGQVANPKGRPKVQQALKWKIQAYFNDAEIEEMVLLLKERIKDPKNISLLQFAVEQIFGRAAQRIEMSGKDGQPIMVLCDPVAYERYKQQNNQNASVSPQSPAISISGPTPV